DILKLDRSLVDGVHRDPAKLALLEAMISFAASTGAAVCGEGIEDLADLRALAALDATYAQGFALGSAAPPWRALEPGVAAASAASHRHGRARPGGGGRRAGRSRRAGGARAHGPGGDADRPDAARRRRARAGRGLPQPAPGVLARGGRARPRGGHADRRRACP